MHDRAAAATKTTADHTGGPRFGLALRMALLLLLYALQGLIFGFVGGALPVLVPGAAFSSSASSASRCYLLPSRSSSRP